MRELFNDIYSNSIDLPPGEQIGDSRSGLPLFAYKFGEGKLRISLIAGCHADEPVGPLLLRKFVSYLSQLPTDSELLTRYQWWIVPHANPDGEKANSSWFNLEEEHIDFTRYLPSVRRELPGDDMEFGFPRSDADLDARPENLAIYQWWKSNPEPFQLHASLHSMAFAGGAWFLIDEHWLKRCETIKSACKEATSSLGYELHDVERHGEKGFNRIEPGFCTRPNSEAMSKYFLEREDLETAAKFRPSSMECVRSFGGDPLTLVSELPFFILPGVGKEIGPPDLAAEEWRKKIHSWGAKLHSGQSSSSINEETLNQGLTPMPISHQMQLQWEFISAGLEQVEETS